MHCPVTGINIPRFLAAAVAGFVFIFGFEFLVHGKLLNDMYDQTGSLWRAKEDTIIPWMLGTQFLTSFIVAYIYALGGKGMEDKGSKCCKCGVGFGLKIGLLIAVLGAAPYAWMPIPMMLALSWAAAGLVKGLGLGVISSLLYKK